MEYHGVSRVSLPIAVLKQLISERLVFPVFQAWDRHPSPYRFPKTAIVVAVKMKSLSRCLIRPSLLDPFVIRIDANRHIVELGEMTIDIAFQEWRGVVMRDMPAENSS